MTACLTAQRDWSDISQARRLLHRIVVLHVGVESIFQQIVKPTRALESSPASPQPDSGRLLTFNGRRLSFSSSGDETSLCVVDESIVLCEHLHFFFNHNLPLQKALQDVGSYRKVHDVCHVCICSLIPATAIKGADRESLLTRIALTSTASRPKALLRLTRLSSSSKRWLLAPTRTKSPTAMATLLAAAVMIPTPSSCLVSVFLHKFLDRRNIVLTSAFLVQNNTTTRAAMLLCKSTEPVPTSRRSWARPRSSPTRST